MMLDDYGPDGAIDPGTFTLVQIQRDPPYSTPWGDARKTFYDVTQYPTAWFDGVEGWEGAYTDVGQMYDLYEGIYLARRAVPTDVTIELGGEEVSGQTYRVFTKVCLEPGGEAKHVLLYVTQVLDHWPPTEDYHRNGFKQTADATDVYLTPGQCGEVIGHEFTFDDDSWAAQDDIKIVAWIQEPEGNAPAEVYQAAVMTWPFPALLEPGTTTVPFFDDFPSTTINETLWTGVEDAEINDLAVDEPSLPYSMNLNGSSSGGDKIRTARMDTGSLPEVLLEYHYQRTGGGDSPEANEDLVVEYFNSSFEWVEIVRYPGEGPDEDPFVLASHVLAAEDALHANFRVQFRVVSSDVGEDDWFVDNVYIYTTPDTDPPEPDPMTWQTPPAPLSTSTINLTATPGTDHWPPVWYSFESSGDCSSSDWQTSSTYVASVTGPNTLCVYQVRARDSAEPPNVGEFSMPASVASDIETPTGLASGATSETTIEVTATGTFTNLDQGSSGLFFQCLEAGTDSGWIQDTTWIAVGLAPGTEHTFTVKARNQTQHETGSVQAYFSTTSSGTCPTQMGDANGDGELNGNDVAAFVRVKLGSPEPGDHPACVSYGDTLEEDLAGFLADLLGPTLQRASSLDPGPEELVQADAMDIVVPGYSVPSFVHWDEDGLKDLVVGEGSGAATPKVRVYLNVGTDSAPAFSTFFYAQSDGSDLTVPGEGCLGLFPRVVYWDGDGLKDLLVGQADGKVSLFLNVNTDDEPLFDEGTILQVGHPGYKVDIDVGLRATPTALDWNSDGKKDLVTGALDGAIHVFLNEGTDAEPDFRSEMLAQAQGEDLIVPASRSSPVILDLDDDGRKDLLAGNTEGQLAFYNNNGDDDAPSFWDYSLVEANGIEIDLPGTPRSRPFVCDWTNDGFLDVLIGAGDGKVHLYQGIPGE
ncbi:MAG: VCBS repeat-containing protein [Phycisphaerae bacterium]|nr:VCBS repeat-containing protein [Phycisphaerae bacterium]